MGWADAGPNLLIGLREGLESGLIVTILLAAVRRSGKSASTAPIWAGVLAAVAMSLSFGALLASDTDLISPSGRGDIDGFLSVLAVAAVTGMIFWVRRVAGGLPGQSPKRVGGALGTGGLTLALTALLAVGREGLDASLFIWTTAQASGRTAAPLTGAVLGIAVAVVVCALLHRRAISTNGAKLFALTGVLLVVVAAGVLASGLGDLQDTGLVPGHALVAFDASAHINVDSWWATIVTGVTNLAARMTWLQVVAYVGYIAVVLAAFRPGSARGVVVEAAAIESIPWWQRRPRMAAGVLAGVVAVPVGAAVLVGLFVQPSAAAPVENIPITRASCAPSWFATSTGPHDFAVANQSPDLVDVRLVQQRDDTVAAEVDRLAPGATVTVHTSLIAAAYQWHCYLPGQAASASPVVTVSGPATPNTGPDYAVAAVTRKKLLAVAAIYDEYVGGRLTRLRGDVVRLGTALRSGSVARSRSAWLRAQLTWESMGAAYGSFGRIGDAIDGLPFGLSRGVRSRQFIGLHRIEWGLWHGQAPATLAHYAAGVLAQLPQLRRQLPALTAAPANLPIRAHEILEDALRDHLSGFGSLGSDAALAETATDISATRVVLRELTPLLRPGAGNLLARIDADLDRLDHVVRGTQVNGRWVSWSTVDRSQRDRIDAAIGIAVADLAHVPLLLELPED